MTSDLLRQAPWECVRADEALSGTPPTSGWLPATVPGTVAGALLDSGDEVALLRDLDAQEWWYRCSVTLPPGPDRWRLELDGLATLAEVLVDGELVLTSTNMFCRHKVEVTGQDRQLTLALRFRPLAAAPTPRRPRARWRTMRLPDQRLRWFRTSLLGRTTTRPVLPAPVGPWRPVRLVPVEDVRVVRKHLQTRVLPDGSGELTLVAEVVGLDTSVDRTAVVRVGDHEVEAHVLARDGVDRVEAVVTLPDVPLWWPHTHGEQPLHAVSLTCGGRTHDLGRVGFRTVEVDRTDGAFTFVVNGVPIFARGTSWTPPDPVRLALSDERLRANVELLRDGNHTMVRVPGNVTWEDDRFLDLLDELGILLWQDCMLAYADPPDDPSFVSSLEEELRQQLGRLQGRPCLALVCGSADTAEQAQYFGVPLADTRSRITEEVVPAVVEEVLPGTAYLASTPGGSPIPTSPREGVTHYFGVPGYSRPLSDVRAAGVRFAAECLPVPSPPDPVTPEQAAAATRGLGRFPDPRQAVHRDSVHSLWDMEDTRDHYVAELFGVTALQVRQQDPGRAEEVFAATAVALVEHVLTEWRRPDSPCAGALTLYGHDLLLGPGLGLVDALDRPKPTWYAVRRLMEPVAVLVSDEGFDGLNAHVLNDRPADLRGTLVLELFVDGETLVETVEAPLVVPGHGGRTVNLAELLDRFVDLSWAHRFGPPAHDVVSVTVRDAHGSPVARAVHLPGGPARARETDVGLTATLEEAEGTFQVRLSTRRLAQWVHLELDGWRAADAWFHLAPGEERVVALRRPAEGPPAPRGRAVALNARVSAPVVAR